MDENIDCFSVAAILVMTFPHCFYPGKAVWRRRGDWGAEN
jgi:hypothetical protein